MASSLSCRSSRAPGLVTSVNKATRPLLRRGAGSGARPRFARSMAPSRRRRTNAKDADEGRVAAAPASSSSSASVSEVPGSEYFRDDERPIILFDGVCNMCNGGVNFVLQWDAPGKLRMGALQSEAGKTLLERSGRRRDDISSIVLVEKGRSLIKSEAVLEIAKRLCLPFPLLTQIFLPLPLFLRDTFYDTVAANRYSIFGKSESCRIGDDKFEDRFVS